jgi:16S rRNA G1207 methylase RsmC
LKKEVLTSFDMIITNPPFAIAQGIIEKSLEFCKGGGYVIMLLRLNYIGSQ